MTTPSSHTPRTRWPISIGPALSLQHTPEIIHNLAHVKTLPPIAAIKGEAGHPSMGHSNTLRSQVTLFTITLK